MVAGIDVGKAHLDVHIAPAGEARQFPNDADDHHGLRKMLHKAVSSLSLSKQPAVITGNCTPAVSRWRWSVR